MAVTKEQIVAKAKELGLTLSDADVQKHIDANTLPEPVALNRAEEIKRKYNFDEVIEMLIETRTEAKERRLENKSLKEQIDNFQKQIASVEELRTKYPNLESELKKTQELTKKFTESEKKRREAVMAKIPEDRRASLAPLMNVEAFGADEFDGVVNTLVDTRGNGSTAGQPTGHDEIKLSEREQRDAERMGLDAKSYREVMDGRRSRAPEKFKTQAPQLPVETAK